MLPCLAIAQAPKALFDDSTLNGWRILGNGSWTVKSGEIQAKLAPTNPQFTHLVYDSVLKDFRVTFLFKSIKGNAGFFFRLQQVGNSPDSISGVQVVIDPALQSDDAFGLYETNGREWIKKWNFNRHKNQYPGASNTCFLGHEWPRLIQTDTICRRPLYKPDDWNRISVWARGPRLIVKLNMRTIVDTVDPTLDHAGRFAFKMHGGQDVEIHFKDIELANFPDLPPGLQSKLKKALLYKGENASPPPMREFIKEIGNENGFAVDEEVETAFNKQNLAQYQTALFLSDYNINFTPTQQADFESWFKADHGALCVHACTRQEVTMAWPWWGKASATQLANHSMYYKRIVGIDKEAEKRTLWKGFDARQQTWIDEWFFWVINPRGMKNVNVILSLVDKDPTGDSVPANLPSAWMSTTEGGRFFAWGGMHTMNAMELPFTYDFLLNALRDAAGVDTVAIIGVNPPSPEVRLSPRLIQVGNSLHVEGKGLHTIEVRDAAGKSIFRATSKDNDAVAFDPPVTSGLLFLTVRTEGQVFTQRVVVAQGLLIGNY